jgi:hypothetical protein
MKLNKIVASGLIGFIIIELMADITGVRHFTITRRIPFGLILVSSKNLRISKITFWGHRT